MLRLPPTSVIVPASSSSLAPPNRSPPVLISMPLASATPAVEACNWAPRETTAADPSAASSPTSRKPPFVPEVPFQSDVVP